MRSLPRRFLLAAGATCAALTPAAALVAWIAAPHAAPATIVAHGLAVAAVQTVLIVAIAQGLLVAPLQRRAQAREEQASLTADEALAARDAEIGALEGRVRAGADELERADREKARFLANLSHELRTPLNGIIAVSEHLAARQQASEAREMAELVVNSGRLLERVLSDALDFASIEAGGVTLVEETFALDALVERVCRLHEAVARTKTLEISWSVTGPSAFRGDPVRVAQVLSNLVSNAVKFTPQGWITVAAEGGAQGVKVSVTDTGPGFDEEVRAGLFLRNAPGEAGAARALGGQGVGLAICRALVDAMGGEIAAASQPGLGSRFTFTLPLTVVDLADDPDAELLEGEATPLRGACVLLAEDHPTNQKVVSLILSSAGVRLTVVEDGQAALDALAAAEFDLVLMDVRMPVMDGLAAVAGLRAREQAQRRPRTPVLMLTADAMAEHVAASQAAGADGHVSKPVRSDELLAAVAAAIAAGPPRRRLAA